MVKKLSSIIVVILVFVIICMTIYKMNKQHEDKLYNVLYSEIKYAANRCFLEEKCNKDITLSELYDKQYLNPKFDPISKEELSKELKITIKDSVVKVEGYDK